MGTNFGEIPIEIQTFSLKKIHLKMSSGKWRPLCLGLNVLKKYTDVRRKIDPYTSFFIEMIEEN